MKQERKFPSVTITKKQAKTLRTGHPWVYEDEILTPVENLENGCLVDVKDEKGIYLGTGMYSTKSKIKIRILGNNANETFDAPFFERRVKYAVQYRKDVMQDAFKACRIIHGESDGLPGLTVDRYNDVLVSEILSYGMDQRKDWIYAALLEEMPDIHAIYERNEGELRIKEGLPQYKGWYNHAQHATVVTIEENGILYEVDVENGQKTGFFLDQKENRLLVSRLAKGHQVLDCCTHTGSFALNAAKGGALHVTALDISASALQMAKHNAQLNHLEDKITFVEGDVFEYLEEAQKEHSDYDFIILDPPAFTKSRKTFNNAYNGYERINRMAMRLLKRSGYLCTASCSHFMPVEEFKTMLRQAAQDSGKQLRIVEERVNAKDHPIHMSIPETEYLKFFIVQIS